METPEEFVPTSIDQQASPGANPFRQSKPAVIILTLVLGLVTFAVGLTGFFHSMKVVAILWHDGTTFPLWADLLVRDIPQLGLSSATVYACLKRSAWGRNASLVFAIVSFLMLLWSLSHPSRYPLFTVTILVQNVGATTQVMTIIGMAVYTGSMLFGRNARAYFAGN